MAKILIIGATGYVGGRLVSRLISGKHQIRCLVRNKRKALGRGWNGIEIFEGDVLKPETLTPALAGIDIAYYLVHSMMAGGGDFESLDRRAAGNMVEACQLNNVKRIIYLGGLGKRDIPQSAHLKSRHEVGDILRSGETPVTEFRAAVIVGSGSLSFEIIHHLVNRLPVMICPRWVYTRTQPIAVDDVLRYLEDSIEKPESVGKVLDIGESEVLTYGDMMLTVGKVLGLKRLLIQVPVLTPKLSSYWINLVTPIPAQVARPLIEGLKYETVRENFEADHIFGFEPVGFEEAVRRAFKMINAHNIESTWTDASRVTDSSAVDPSHLFSDRRTHDINAPAETVFRVISSAGGDNGWFYASWLWKLRGFIDRQLGGVGYRIGRRHPQKISIGETIDFWRVEDYIPDSKLSLRAEMKVWGRAWLKFEVKPIDKSRSRMVQTAQYYPKGLWGLFYWYSVLPLHKMVFRGMSRAIKRKAEEQNVSR